MELEEVQRTHPGITCLRFPTKDAAAVWNLLGELRDLFGKPVLTEEDRLRQSSIRASAQIQELTEGAASPEFLGTLQGTVTIDWGVDSSDKRPLELINKTNQFNLNGVRIEEGEWRRRLEDDNNDPRRDLLSRQVRPFGEGRGSTRDSGRGNGQGVALGDELPGILPQTGASYARESLSVFQRRRGRVRF